MNLDDQDVATLMERIYSNWGYDFRDYAAATLKRRVQRFMDRENLSSISSLTDLVLTDPEAVRWFSEQIIVSVTSMYRDPEVFLTLRQEVFPLLNELPQIRIWHAGCASGEEVYSILIMLHEAGLLSRTQVYATDIDQESLGVAKEGIYPLKNLQESEENYNAAGGKALLSDYYSQGHGYGVFKKYLSKNVVWATHNLVTDASFNEFHLILMRNVLTHFNDRLRFRALRLVHESMREGGCLVIGRSESLRTSPLQRNFRPVASRAKIYEKGARELPDELISGDKTESYMGIPQ